MFMRLAATTLVSSKSQRQNDPNPFKVDAELFDYVVVDRPGTHNVKLQRPLAPVCHVTVVTTQTHEWIDLEKQAGGNPISSKIMSLQPSTERMPTPPPSFTSAGFLCPQPHLAFEAPPAYEAVERKSNAARTLFFIGFLFPLAWIAGACMTFVVPRYPSMSKYQTNRRMIIEAQDPTSRWAWWCICAFVIEIFIISMLFVSLYGAHIL